jgi:nucleotide-binding universal stress UspA family protein
MALEAEPPSDGLALGPGELVEESFLGSTRRVRVRVPRLSRVRQIAPVVPYGEEGFLLDAAVAGDASIPARPWVHLKQWRVLRRPPPRLLACSALRGSDPPIDFALKLVEAIGGSAILLAVAREPAQTESVTATWKRRVGESVELRVRAGNPSAAILQEQSESFYELLVISNPRRGRGEPELQRLLGESATPMLFARTVPESFRRIIICTAVGEPGKGTVRFGGWLAFRLRAETRLLHVSRTGREASATVRAHLDAGIATLRALEVSATAQVRAARAPMEGILEEAAEWDADLVVIGGHGPLSRSVTARDDVTLQMLARSERPVLVVPGESG